MARLIEDKNLIEYIKSEELARRVIRSKDSIRDILIEVINEQPTVDAVEVVHGEWISLTDCSNAGVYCSVCKKKVWKEDYAWCNRKNKLRSNYCPNCGADMRVGRWKGEGMGDYSCSLCGEVVSGNHREKCPNCHAKMDGGDKA